MNHQVSCYNSAFSVTNTVKHRLLNLNAQQSSAHVIEPFTLKPLKYSAPFNPQPHRLTDKDKVNRSNFIVQTMPSTEIALAIRHYPRQRAHLSRLENTRRADISLEAYQRALERARTTILPTPDQRTMLYLPLNNENLSHFAWRTSLLQGNHTNALIPVPREFALFLAVNGPPSILPSSVGRYSYLVARKSFGPASAVMRMRYSTSSLDAAELEWIGGTAAENNQVSHVKTVLELPFAGSQFQSELTRQWPGPFSRWIESVLLKFASESAWSSIQHRCLNNVWEEAARAARTSIAVAITDSEAELQFLRLPGNEALLLQE